MSNAVPNANVRRSDDYDGNASTSTYGQSITTDKTHHLTTVVAAVIQKVGKRSKEMNAVPALHRVVQLTCA